ncbi:hypothetical protein ABZ920_18965 [Streptomyces sp. NPDC046831]|uniref:hypothetical protein n=1 Tax=Streptomyces sp. NPDC046831 TaxID=3154805 RepID=UPI00341037A0
MTSATLSRAARTATRRRVRIAAAAAFLAGALSLTACSGGDGSDDGAAASSTASATTSPTATAGTGDGPGGPSADAGGLAGSWLATTGGKAVVLVVNGSQAGLFTTGKTVCSGTAGEQSGQRTIRLKCNNGDEDRTAGVVDSVNKTTLEVTWQGGLGKETYTRSEGGTLPPGLPTASLGS